MQAFEPTYESHKKFLSCISSKFMVKKTNMKIILALILIFNSSLSLSSADAPKLPTSQPTWPQKPIRIIVAAPPGSSVDIVSRLIADKLKDQLRQPVIVDNKPAAGGTVAAAEVAKAGADGYTLYMGFNGPLANAPALYKNLPYDHDVIFRRSF